MSTWGVSPSPVKLIFPLLITKASLGSVVPIPTLLEKTASPSLYMSKPPPAFIPVPWRRFTVEVAAFQPTAPWLDPFSLKITALCVSPSAVEVSVKIYDAPSSVVLKAATTFSVLYTDNLAEERAVVDPITKSPPWK